MLAPGPVASIPFICGLVGGSQVQSKAQVASQEQAQNDDKAQQEDDPWKSQEQVLGQKSRASATRLWAVGPVLTHHSDDPESNLTHQAVYTA